MNLLQLVDHLGDNLQENHLTEKHNVWGVTCDSRKITPGTIFVAIKGAQFNGEDFITQAFEKGAPFIVSESSHDNIEYLKVNNAYQAMSSLAEIFAGLPASELELIGITGTNGKSSTTFILEHILCSSGIKTGVIGTIHNRFGDIVETANMTTPDPVNLQQLFIRMRDEDIKSVVMEVSSHALAQHRIGSLPVKTAIFTNLTQDHLDYHGDMESYFAAKRLLFDEFLHESGFAIVNIDDASGAILAKSLNPENLISVGFQKAEFQIHNVIADRLNTSFELISKSEKLKISVPLQGDFNVMNTALASVAALKQGVSAEEVEKSLQSFPGVPGRLELFCGVDGRRVYVDYAHTPDALEKVLETLKPLGKKLICLFGCGGDRDKTKRPKMAAAAERLADLVIVTDDNPRTEDSKTIITDISQGFKKLQLVQVEADRYKAIEHGISLTGPDDIFLVAGKGHEDYQIYGKETLSFCDRTTVKELLERISA